MLGGGVTGSSLAFKSVCCVASNLFLQHQLGLNPTTRLRKHKASLILNHPLHESTAIKHAAICELCCCDNNKRQTQSLPDSLVHSMASVRLSTCCDFTVPVRVEADLLPRVTRAHSGKVNPLVDEKPETS